MQGQLMLEDGRTFTGRFFGAPRRAVAEVVFNTGMTGYQEIVTDPSYFGQAVVLTTAQVGNTGVNERDAESDRPQATALIVREASRRTSSWRATKDLDAYLREHDVPGLTDIDTRALTRHLRDRGAMMGIIAPADAAVDELRQELAAVPAMSGRDLASRVTCRAPYQWSQAGAAVIAGPGDGDASPPTGDVAPRRIVAVDFGIKRSILRRLIDAGFHVTVVPATTSAGEIMACDPHGVFLSNGPGDPAACSYAIETVRQLLGRVPIFGICLGHQILALALGGRTFKLKFGHRGSNHPVRDPAGGPVTITAQNHGFAVAPELPGDVGVTQINLNDGTIEGIDCPSRRAFSVQYHPEAGPGPHDAAGLFTRFRKLIDGAGLEPVIAIGRNVSATSH